MGLFEHEDLFYYSLLLFYIKNTRQKISVNIKKRILKVSRIIPSLLGFGMHHATSKPSIVRIRTEYDNRGGFLRQEKGIKVLCTSPINCNRQVRFRVRIDADSFDRDAIRRKINYYYYY